MSLILIVSAMLAPYVLAAALTTTYPSLQRGFGLRAPTDAVIDRARALLAERCLAADRANRG